MGIEELKSSIDGDILGLNDDDDDEDDEDDEILEEDENKGTLNSSGKQT